MLGGSLAHLLLSEICSCIMRSLAGGIYAPPEGGEEDMRSSDSYSTVHPPVRVRMGSTSFFAGAEDSTPFSTHCGLSVGESWR